MWPAEPTTAGQIFQTLNLEGNYTLTFRTNDDGYTFTLTDIAPVEGKEQTRFVFKNDYDARFTHIECPLPAAVTRIEIYNADGLTQIFTEGVENVINCSIRLVDAILSPDFTNYTSVEYIHFQNKHATSIVVPPGNLVDTLWLSGCNQLTNLDQVDFTNVRTLRIDDTNIEELPDDMPNLGAIWMENTRITRLPSNSNLGTLFAKGARLTSVYKELPDGAGLGKWDLTDNPLTTPPIFRNMENINPNANSDLILKGTPLPQYPDQVGWKYLRGDWAPSVTGEYNRITGGTAAPIGFLPDPDGPMDAGATVTPIIYNNTDAPVSIFIRKQGGYSLLDENNSKTLGFEAEGTAATDGTAVTVAPNSSYRMVDDAVTLDEFGVFKLAVVNADTGEVVVENKVVTNVKEGLTSAIQRQSLKAPVPEEVLTTLPPEEVQTSLPSNNNGGYSNGGGGGAGNAPTDNTGYAPIEPPVAGPTRGCKDPDAANYDASAVITDNSLCTYALSRRNKKKKDSGSNLIPVLLLLALAGAVVALSSTRRRDRTPASRLASRTPSTA